MTTKFLDNKICTFKILLSWRFPRKQAFLDDFPLCPQGPPPLKSENFIFIVVSPSLSFFEAKPRSCQTGGFPTFFGTGRGPFRDCSSQALLIGRERGKGQIRKIPEESPSLHPKNLLRLFFRNNLTRLNITLEVKNNLKRLFLTLF